MTVREVAERYKAAWSPGVFWPRDAFMHTKKTDQGLAALQGRVDLPDGWLSCASFFLIFAGVSPIEVFREEAHLRAAMCVGRGLCLCAIWPVLFPHGSARSVATGLAATSGEDEKVGARWARSTHSKTKEVFLWLSFGCCCIAASSRWPARRLQAWTLPGPAVRHALFLGPGYGLFAGWLLFAAALNLTHGHQLQQLPVGHAAVAGDAHRVHAPRQPVAAHPLARDRRHRGADPSTRPMPLPMLVAIFLFTPREKAHLAASFVCLLGIVVAVVLVVWKRSD